MKVRERWNGIERALVQVLVVQQANTRSDESLEHVVPGEPSNESLIVTARANESRD